MSTTVESLRRRAQKRIAELEAEIAAVRADLEVLDRLAGTPPKAPPERAAPAAPAAPSPGGMTRGQMSKETKEKIIDLALQGLNHREIADKVGKNQSTISRFLSQGPSPQPPPEETTEAKAVTARPPQIRKPLAAVAPRTEGYSDQWQRSIRGGA